MATKRISFELNEVLYDLLRERARREYRSVGMQARRIVEMDLAGETDAGAVYALPSRAPWARGGDDGNDAA